MRSAFFFFCSLILFSSCAAQPVNLARLEHFFAKAEYISNGDGWAEARRRTLLKEYLRKSGIPYEELQRDKAGTERDKYKNVTIALPGSAENTTDYRVTLALVPAQKDEARHTAVERQRQCDKTLFGALRQLAELRSGYRRILLTMDSACHAEGLTGRVGAAK